MIPMFNETILQIQLLAKLNIRSLPNNTRNDIPEDVRRQIAAIYQVCVFSELITFRYRNVL